MRIRVLFFGVLRDTLGQSEEVIAMPEGATVGDVLAHYRGRVDSPIWSAVAVALNRQYAELASSLTEGDELALLPPVSGGTPQPLAVSITWQPIDAAAIVESVRQGEDGAVVTFDGIVRNNTRGRQTLFLDYQGYEGMALSQMQALTAEASERFSVRAATIVHRLGRLEIGETSVLVVVASAHRGAAFDACRWIIDSLKKTVPIWKKEHFVDGSVWADGEPFPEQILKGQPG